MAYESVFRLAAFLTAFAAVAWLEARTPRRTRSFKRRSRWPSNLGVVVLNSFILRILLPAGIAGFALVAEQRRWGLLNNLQLSALLAGCAAFVILDLTIYLQHVMFHAVPALWRIHRMHHADLDFDVTTGLRFHPAEIVLSGAIKLIAVAALGPPAAAVLLFEIALNASSMFNHGNLYLPLPLDRILRRVVVTPDMHRVHHSIMVAETNSNFGFNLSWWDRLLGTYRAQPAAGHAAMIIGIEQFRAPRELVLDRMLTQPLRGPAGAYPLAGSAAQ